MKKTLCILLVVFFLIGCSTKPIIPSPTPPNNMVMPTVITISPTVIQPTLTPEATSTSTVEPISAPTAIYNQEAGVESKCVKVDQEVQDANLADGVVVLENRSTGSDNRYEPGFYLLDMATGVLTNLDTKDERLKYGAVSPDGTLLSAEVVFSRLLIMRADGKVEKEIPLEKEWGSSAVWQDNQHLVITSLSRSEPDESMAPKIGQLWLNPFTGERRVLLDNDFPNIYYTDQWGHNLVVYSPSLTRAIYLAESGYTFVLWDMQKKSALIQWVSYNNDHLPRWSPNGSKFLMDVSDPSDTPGDFANGLYLVDNNGKVLLPPILDAEDEIQIPVTEYFWSDSGRYVALLAFDGKGTNREPKERLLILNIQTRQITDYCVEFIPFGANEPSLIWSPDETQLLLNDRYDEDHRRVILVDLSKGTAFPIAEDKIATGWMKSP